MRLTILSTILFFLICNFSFSQFTKEVDVSAQMGIVYTETGHIDNDSITDIVLGSTYQLSSSNSESMRILWIKLDSTGRSVSQTVIDSLSCREIIVTDIDNDNDDDIITLTGSLNSGDIMIYENMGCGEFSDATILNSGLIIHTLSTGDFNGDGFVDLAIVRINDLVVIMNDGNGNYPIFEPVVSGGFSNENLVCGDINGDGIDDISYARSGDIHYLTGSLSGAFSTVNTLDFSPGYMQYFKIADLDSDNDNDFIAKEEGGGPQDFYLAANDNNNGNFSVNFLMNTTYSNHFLVRDYDANGTMDIITSYTEIKAHLNDGNQNFQTEIVTTNNSSYTDLIANDFNFDGNLDILYRSTTSELAIKGNTINGSGFPPGRLNWNEDFNERCLAAGDLNNDGLTDIVVSTYSDNKTYVYFQDTLGHFFFPKPISTWGFSSDANVATICDVNNDGSNDLVVSTGSGMKWLEYTGTTWTTNQLSNASNLSAIDTYDFDNDGDLDIAMINSNGTQVSVISNDGFGNFTLVDNEMLPFNSGPKSILFADINNDTYTDVLFSEKNPSTGILYMSYIPGNTSFTFDPIIRIDSIPSVKNFVLSDLDSDGLLDIVVAGGDLTAFYNQGNGAYTKNIMSTIGSNLNAQHVVCGDIDGDSDMDIYVAGFDELHCFEQTSTGTFNDYLFGWNEHVRNMRLIDVHNNSTPELITLSQTRKLAYYTDSLDFGCPVVLDTSTANIIDFELNLPTFKMDVFPNPNSGLFTVSFDEVVHGNISVCDLAGRIVANYSIDGLNLSLNKTLNAGQYLVIFEDSDLKERAIERVIIQ